MTEGGKSEKAKITGKNETGYENRCKVWQGHRGCDGKDEELALRPGATRKLGIERFDLQQEQESGTL